MEKNKTGCAFYLVIVPKRLTIFSFLCSFISLAAFAQIGYGPEVGIGMSSMKFAPEQGFTSASGSSVFSWRAGGVADIPANRHIYFQVGLLFTQKGQNRDFSFYTSDTLNASVKQTLTLYYADVPVNVIYKTGMQGKGRFFAGLGVTPSYLLAGRNSISKEVSIMGTPYISSLDQSTGYRNPIAMFDIGLNISTGYELATGLFFRAYYTAGVRDLGLGTETDKNRIWGISVGWLFGKGRDINKEADDLIDRTEE